MNPNCLNDAISMGIIDVSHIQQMVEMEKRRTLLERHEFSIWCDQNGYWHTYIRDGTGRRVHKKKKCREELEDIVLAYNADFDDTPTIKDVFMEWNDHRYGIGKISEGTYRRNIQVYNRHYKEFGKTKINKLDAFQLEEFLEGEIHRCNLTSKAFANLKSITKGFLKRAKKRALIDFSIEETLQDMDVSDREFRKVVKEDYEEVFSEDETARMMQYLEEHDDMRNCGIYLMFITGMRVGELAALRHEDIDIEYNAVRVRNAEVKHIDEKGKISYIVKDFPKTRAGLRVIAIPTKYKPFITKLWWVSSQTGFVFTEDGARIDSMKFRKRLYKNCKTLGIYKKSPHKIRKTYGTMLMDSGLDTKFICEQMGHEDIAVTEKHYHRNRRSLTKKTQIIDSVPEFGNCQNF